MNRKKYILIACIVLIIFLLVILIIPKNKNKTTIVKSKPLNENVKLEEVFEKIEELRDVSIADPNINEEENQNIEKKIDEAEIDFNKYNVLEKKAIVNTTDEKVDEVWMIKLGSYEQQEDVCRIFGNRIQKLRKAFEDNETQTQILNNAIIKQEDGIVIMIISDDANKIEELIAKEM